MKIKTLDLNFRILYNPLAKARGLFLYLHIGEDTTIYGESLIGIFDIDKTTVSPITRNFLRRAEEAGQVLADSQGLPRAMIVTDYAVKRKVHLSIVRPITIAERASCDGGF